MQIAVSFECRNDQVKNFIPGYFHWLNNENNYTELQILLTGDLSTLTRSGLTVKL